ncbi:MAG: hypothetical protein EP344_17170 [Bacteroidetes bacterium]|nr:MAG: hypothetical protein EP344_17170 [Bacteroidota bacterium]
MAAEFRLFNDVSRALSPELPRDLGTMDQHLDFILPKIIPYGEDLREEKFWIAKRWKEVRDDEGFHEAILHIFNTGGEYLLSLDGNLVKGTWRQLGEENSLIIEIAGKSELFDLRFMNADFIVLTKHGDQGRKGQRRYFCLIHERVSRSRTGQDLDWRNIMEKLFNIWRDNSLSMLAWIIFIGILGGIIYLSVN